MKNIERTSAFCGALNVFICKGWQERWGCQMPLIYTFAGYSNTGKTTYLEKLIPCLLKMGIRVSVLKHDAHSIQLDTKGKDTWRFTQAGAAQAAIVSQDQFVFFQREPVSLEIALTHFQDVDLILIEGYKNSSYPKIAVYREKSGKGLAVDAGSCTAVVTDVPLEVPCPVFPLDDPKPLAEFLNGEVQKTKGGQK